MSTCNNTIQNIILDLQLLHKTDYYATAIYSYAQEAQKDGRQITPDNYFMLSNEEVASNLKFTRYQQSTGLKQLQELGLIEVKLMGFPAFRFVKLNKINQ